MNTKFLYTGILFLMLLAFNGVAQDTIYMRNDQRIVCTVHEISTTEVKYKKWALSDGPMYIEDKSQVAQIKYKNGFIDVFQEVKPSPVQIKKAEDDYVKNPQKDKLIVIGANYYLHGSKLLKERGMHQLLLSVNNPQITKEVKRAKLDKRLKYVGFVAIPLAVGAAACVQIASHTGPGYPKSTNTQREDFMAAAVVCTVGAAATFSASIYFGIDRKVRNARAVRLYQQQYE
jgi:hypothetical protein